MRILTDENIFRSSYFKNICPCYEQFLEPEKLFSRLTDDPAEIKRRQDILRDLLDNSKLFGDLCSLSDTVKLYKATFDGMPDHDRGDFRLNLEYFDAACGVIELLDRFLKSAEYTGQYPWLVSFSKSVGELAQKYSAEKMIAAWKQTFVPEENMHACDFGFSLDDILWPKQYKLLSMRAQEYTRRNCSYRIEQIKIPFVDRAHVGVIGSIRGINHAPVWWTHSKSDYSQSYILKVYAANYLEEHAVSDAPFRVKLFATALIAELESIINEFVPYLCAAKIALYWREKGIPFCIPEFGKPGEIDIKGLFNPYIVENEGIETTIENDIALSGEIAVVTGANRGGKTAFVTSVTLCQILFQLGFPIPAKSAKLGLFNGIITVFAGEEQGLIGTGRLGEELKKLAAGLKAAQEGNTLICFNEPLTGTSSRDGERILAETLCILKESEATGFVVTHLLGLAHALDFLNQVSGSAFVTLTAQTDGDKPLYKIIPAPAAETSHARAVVYDVMYNSTN
ncbi:MAG TPA: hypothetical protein PLV03_03430 [Clostridiales bacterium]|nr:hypothetical protein [Clostridiales bacterium]HPK34645.1 hypothetical protein [Oscillospiraceae bacterium]HPR74590.1 hypothetical protein [Oscillospiraceae bacterium]